MPVVLMPVTKAEGSSKDRNQGIEEMKNCLAKLKFSYIETYRGNLNKDRQELKDYLPHPHPLEFDHHM